MGLVEIQVFTKLATVYFTYADIVIIDKRGDVY